MYFTKATIKENTNDVFTAIASTGIEDRQGEIVEPSGWQLKNYKANPILLLHHDHTMPLGKATKVWVDKTTSKAKLMFKGFISTATDYGKAAKQLMEEGILNTFSVGFKPIEMDGNTITKSELYEISLVSVPANPEARTLAVKTLEKHGFDQKLIKSFVSEDEREEELEEETPGHEEKDPTLADLRKEVAEVLAIATKASENAELAVKGLSYLNPHRSKREVVTTRLQLSKVIAKAADKILTDKPMPVTKTVSTAKVIKRSSEILIRNLKQDL